MDIKDYFDLYFAFESNIEFHWNFYLILIFASIGWLLSLKQHPSRNLKVLATVGFLVISGYDIFLLLSNYTFLEAIQSEMKTLVNNPSFSAEALKERVLWLPSFSFYLINVLGIHFLGGSIILIGLWSNRIWETFRYRRRGDT